MNCKIGIRGLSNGEHPFHFKVDGGIRGLSNGEHPFHFKVDGSFFEAYESDTVSDAELDVNALITKEPGRISVLQGT